MAKILGFCGIYLYGLLSFHVIFLIPHLILEFKETFLFPNSQDTQTACIFILKILDIPLYASSAVSVISCMSRI